MPIDYTDPLGALNEHLGFRYESQRKKATRGFMERMRGALAAAPAPPERLLTPVDLMAEEAEMLQQLSDEEEAALAPPKEEPPQIEEALAPVLPGAVVS